MDLKRSKGMKRCCAFGDLQDLDDRSYGGCGASSEELLLYGSQFSSKRIIQAGGLVMKMTFVLSESDLE